MSRWRRRLAMAMAGVALGLGVLVYLGYIYNLGFPDGFVTELGQAQRRLAFGVVGLSLTVGIYCLGLGLLNRRGLRWAIALYGLGLLGALVVNAHLVRHLPGGGGG